MKESPYDILLNWIVTPICNFNCAYCAVSRKAVKDSPALPINISALMKTLSQTHKVFHITFLGGEPFIVPNLVEACSEITKYHFISISTNLVSKNISNFVEQINPKRVVYILASFHIEGLEKEYLIKRYIDNFLMLREKGFVMQSKAVAYPPLLGKINHYRKVLREEDIELQFLPCKGNSAGQEHLIEYTKEEMRLFGIKKPHVKVFKQYNKTCNAGYNIAVAWMNGDVTPCFNLRDICLGNIYKKIEFVDKLRRCPFSFCGCPLNHFDKSLFAKALRKNFSLTALPYLINYELRKNFFTKKKL